VFLNALSAVWREDEVVRLHDQVITVVFAVAVGKPLQAPAKQVKPLCFGLLLLSQATLVKRGPQLA
jgi:hypothetical protein